MKEDGNQELEDFFKLFHEPFSTWVADLESMRGKNLLGQDLPIETKNEALLDCAGRIERLCALLSSEFREHFSPASYEIWSAKILHEHFREMNEIARHFLKQTESQKLQPETIRKLRWLAEITLDSLIRSSGH